MHRSTKHIKYSENLWKPCVLQRTPHLLEDTIHVWKADLGLASTKTDLLWPCLSLEEKEKAERFYFEKDKLKYISARAILRMLLGMYLGVEPNEVQFFYTAFGKPYLENDIPLRFNVSHSGSFALFAFNYHHLIGVDIEKVKPAIDIETIVSRFFSHNEATTVLNLRPKDRPNAFYKCWTRKEAFIKGHGEGLSLPLDQFEVSILDETPVELQKVNWDEDSAAEWSLYSFEPADAYQAALIVHSKNKSLKYYEWTNE